MPEAKKRPVGRPQGPPHAVVNIRVPLDLLERLDRFTDHLIVREGQKGANRATVMREALAAFLDAKGY